MNKTKFDATLAVVVQEHEHCVAVNLERGAEKLTIRLYPQNDSETQKSARDFAALIAGITNANWQVIQHENQTS